MDSGDYTVHFKMIKNIIIENIWREDIVLTDQQLQEWVEQISLQYFQRPFEHKAVFNRRLSRTGGRYFIHSHNIDISWKHYQMYGKEEIEKIIKHELCHYHLHLQQKGYKHGDEDFKQLLRKVGGSRYCKALPSKSSSRPFRYILKCKSCQAEYYRKKRMDPKRYVCGKCSGKLILIERK